MAMRREAGVQADLVVTWAEMPRSPGHAFYDRLQSLLSEAGFDTFVEDTCKPYYAPRCCQTNSNQSLFAAGALPYAAKS
jgi:transposase